MVIIKKTQFHPSFTLMELTVAIAIIGVLLTLTSINYRTANSKSLLTMAAYQIAGDARLMQSYAASARQYGPDTPPNNEWGIFFELSKPSEYILYIDKNSSGTYTAENDSIWRTGQLPRGVKIVSLKYRKRGESKTGLPNNSASSAMVTYSPPTPSSTLNIIPAPNSNVPIDEIHINLSNDDLTQIVGQTVSLNFFGLIDVIK